MDEASIYVRLSVAAGESNLSLSGMEEDCRSLCERLGATVRAVHVDNGISGSVRDRPQFKAWLADAVEGRSQILATWSVDRLSREGTAVAGIVLDVVEGKDRDSGKVVRPPVRLVDHDGLDSFRTDTEWRLVFGIKAEIARAERDRMSARAKAMHRRAAESGRWVTGPPPFGWTPAPHEGGGVRLVEQPGEAEALRRAADRLIAGDNLRVAMRELDATAPRRTPTWGHSSARAALRSPRNRALLGFTRWTAVQDVFADKELGARRGRPLSRLLSGLVACTGCQYPMTVGKSSGASVYRCRWWTTRPEECDGKVAINAARADEHLTELYLAMFGRIPYSETVAVDSSAVDEAEEHRARALKAIAASPTAEALAELQAATSSVEQAKLAPVVRNRTATGTLADEWAAADGDVARRRRQLADVCAFVEVLPSTKAGKFDPERLLPEWKFHPSDLV